LSPKAVNDFVQFQQGLQTKERKHGKASVNVSFDFDRSESEELKPFELSILLKIKADEDYFTLIDKAKIKKFEKNRPEQKNSPEDAKQPVEGND
jgi:hypothetical protein